MAYDAYLPQLHPIHRARQTTERVQQDLEIASAELGLAHDALETHVPPEHKQGDVAWAIGQNAVAEQKVQQAAQELETVTELLREEEAQRHKLEEALARRDAG